MDVKTVAITKKKEQAMTPSGEKSINALDGEVGGVGIDGGVQGGEGVTDGFESFGDGRGLRFEHLLLGDLLAISNAFLHRVFLRFADEVIGYVQLAFESVAEVLEAAGVDTEGVEVLLGEGFGFGLEFVNAGIARLDELTEGAGLDEGVGAVEVDVVGSDEGCG